jgi:hypothetical protein
MLCRWPAFTPGLLLARRRNVGRPSDASDCRQCPSRQQKRRWPAVPRTLASFLSASRPWLALWRRRGDNAPQLSTGDEEPLPLCFLLPSPRTRRPTTRWSGVPRPSCRCVRALEGGHTAIKRLSGGSLWRRVAWLRSLNPFPFPPSFLVRVRVCGMN